MNTKTNNRARRFATIVFPLTLVLALLIGWSVWADDAPPGMNGAAVQYEIPLRDAGTDRLEVLLPLGFEYVGLAAGSEFGIEPEISASGDRLIWYGPFGEAAVLRFWLAPVHPTEAPSNLPITEAGVEATRIDAPVAPPLTRPSLAPSSEQAPAVTVSKEVEVKPDWPINLWVTYQVLFTNDGPGIVTLNWITDTLPAGFVFGGMAAGSDITNPPSIDGSVLVWDTSTYPEEATFADTLTMRYHVRAVNRAGEYQNSVVALAGDQQIGPASATLTIDRSTTHMPMAHRNFLPPRPRWQLSKTANPPAVEAGNPVVYTVVLKNVGNLAGTAGSLVDVLPADFTFNAMVSGPPPSVADGTLTWSGPWELDPNDSVNLSYRVTSGGSGLKVNTVKANNIIGAELARASSTVALGGLPFEDEFSNESPDWHRFDNWPGLSPWHWDWGGQPGVWGIWGYDWTEPTEYTGYSLLIYNDPAAEGWTDYEVELRLRDSKDDFLQKGLSGLWLRGTYQDSGAEDGKTVGGYYVYMKVSDNRIYLMRTPPGDPSFASQVIVASGPTVSIRRDRWYKLIVRVKGANIQVWFENDEDSVDNPVAVLNWTDPNPAWSSGTVGLAVYNTTARFDYIRVLPVD
ncbi:MAG TPA: family 16 glycoside hydrolase [Anaerolineae bacterium]|nr:family 16 glycoside hydrolase [Anaerolineae bacterium]